MCLWFCFLLESTCRWNYTVFVFLWLSISIMPSGSNCVIANGKISSLLWLNIPFYTYTTTLSIHPLMDTHSYYGILLISMFWLLQMMLPWTWGYTCIFKLVFAFVDTCPKAELLDHTVILILNFEDSPYYFPQQLNYFATPPTGYMGLLFSNIPCLHTPSWVPGLSEYVHHGLRWGMGVSWWWFLTVLEQNQCNIADCIIFQGVPVQKTC